MDPLPEYSLFLVRILDELDTKHKTMSYQDLCKSLCARFDLVQLAKLRSLLFYTACLDPAFPATLFKDKMRCSMEDPQSKKLMVAADIVTMFNLIQMNGGMVKDKLPTAHRGKFHKNQSLELGKSDDDSFKFQDCDRRLGYEHMDHPRAGHHHHHPTKQLPGTQSATPSSECKTFQPFIPSSDPNFLLGVNKDLKCRAASLDKLHHLPQYSNSSPPSPPCAIESTYFPMDMDSECTTDQESLQHMGPPEPFSVHSCIQKRNVFKEDFHNFVAFSPQVCVFVSRKLLKDVRDGEQLEVLLMYLRKKKIKRQCIQIGELFCRNSKKKLKYSIHKKRHKWKPSNCIQRFCPLYI